MDDTVSRAAAIDVMCELMHHWFGGDPKDEVREIKRELEKLPSVQTCEDAVSRQAAIDAVHEEFDECLVWDESGRRTADEVEQILDKLPAVQPEVVYCKKCKHWTRTCGDEQWGLGDCDVFDKHLVMCNGYCAWAERRTE